MYKPQKKSFKEYYADPEYRKRHDAHMMEHVTCEICGSKTARCNMSKHRKTQKHLNNLNCKEKHEKLTRKLFEIKNEFIRYYLNGGMSEFDFFDASKSFVIINDKIDESE